MKFYMDMVSHSKGPYPSVPLDLRFVKSNISGVLKNLRSSQKEFLFMTIAQNDVIHRTCSIRRGASVQ